MTTVYRESDADPTILVGRQVAVLGYGSLGRPIALNMRNSGLSVLIGSLADEYAAQATSDGFVVVPLAEAADHAEIIWMLLPDEAMAEAYSQHVSQALSPNNTLVFASGYSLTFGFIEPPPFVDTVLIAPRTVGAAVREGYLSGRGYRSLIAVEQDGSGQAWPTALALAWAIGALRAGALETTFRQETELDLFVQQAVLPALHHLLVGAANVLIDSGYPPEAALLDLYMGGDLGYALSAATESGFSQTLRFGSLTGQYGALSRLERFADPRLRRQMETVLSEIRTGKFAQDWAAEYGTGYARLNLLKERYDSLALWAQEKQALRTWQSIPSPTNSNPDGQKSE